MRNVRALFACATIAAARADPASAAELVRYHTKRSRTLSADRRRTLHAILLCSRPALQPISVDFFFLLNEPSLNGDAKLFFFLGGVASAAVVVVVVAVLSRRRRYLAAKNAMDVSFLPWAPRDGRRPTVSGL